MNNKRKLKIILNYLKIQDLLGLKDLMDKIKTYLYNIAMKSPLRKWALSLTGWKWWVWQLVVGGIFFFIIELLLNLIGMTIIPWK